jgi:GrpB-like predicted nucleotidyltransferase (UPF0157 family)
MAGPSVRVVEYDPEWPRRFAQEEALLGSVLGDDVVIEHIGSTAVPGLSAKPIIDVMAGVRGWDGFDVMVERLAAVGYRYTPEAEEDDPSRRVFRKGPPDLRLMRTHHLHVTERGCFYWRRMVTFRDRLREHPEEAAAYVDLKRDLATRFESEPRRYTAAKHGFVTEIERRAGVRAGVDLGQYSFHPRTRTSSACGECT